MRVHPASSIPNEPFEALASKISRCGGADQREKTAANCAGGASFRCSAAQNRRPLSELRPQSLLGSGWPANRSCKAAKVGAGDGNRTHDTQLGKLMFYH